ncbi:MAG: hypothetical protein GY805_10710, partial [Chloroflexi bacterium]|nr:hypothetical protein [Chloroflexota bacterium]
MIHHREKSEVRRFDIIKLIVLIILIALLLWFWLAPPAFVRGADDGGETAVAAETEPEIEADTADDSDIAEEMDETVEEEAAAEEEEMPQIDAPSLDSPTAGEALEAGSTTLSGGGTPGSTVRIMIDGQEVGVAEVGADGSWSHDLDLTAGSREISFEALDADGNVAATAASAIFEVAAPPIPLDTPSFDAFDTNLQGGPLTLSGGGTPGSTVGIWVDGVEVGTTEVDADGNWSFDADLEAGDHDLRLQAIDLDGNVAGESEDFGLSLAVPPPEFVLPTFDLPDADLAGGDITLSGTGTPGSEVEIVVNGEVVGTAVVADDGTWSFPATLPSGDYELALRAMDGSGTAVSSDPFAFSLAATAAVPTLDAPADGSSLDSGEISFSGTGEP